MISKLKQSCRAIRCFNTVVCTFLTFLLSTRDGSVVPLVGHVHGPGLDRLQLVERVAEHPGQGDLVHLAKLRAAELDGGIDPEVVEESVATAKSARRDRDCLMSSLHALLTVLLFTPGKGIADDADKRGPEDGPLHGQLHQSPDVEVHVVVVRVVAPQPVHVVRPHHVEKVLEAPGSTSPHVAGLPVGVVTCAKNVGRCVN